MARTERRVVTVVFADLVGFTTLAERLDADDVALVQDGYFTGAAQAIADHGGQVEKFIGDAVVATFGVPHAGDDDPDRAVRAALAIVDAIAWVEAELGLEQGTLRVRVGVNTGEVVVVHAADGTWRLAGDAVNVAARLQAAAEPGSVLVGPETAFAIAGAFVTEPVGALDLKGKTSSVAAWRIVRPRPIPSRGNGSSKGSPPRPSAGNESWARSSRPTPRLLDGVMRVEVGGRRLAEIGPGALLGERAVVEGGRRTATLTSVTACRVAVAAADQLDRSALEAVSQGITARTSRSRIGKAVPPPCTRRCA